MGRSKNVKPFIDKKNAATFHLVRRSQRDVIGHMDDSDGVPNEFVLMPSPMNPPKYSQMIVLDRAAPKDESSPPVVELSSSYMNHVKQCLSTGAPHVLKDFNAEIYEKYTKPITGEGIFVSAKGNTSAISDAPAPSSLMQELASALPGHEVERTFESITINPDCMDPEVAAALFGDWEVAQGGDDADGENVFEEILDDFVLTACQEPTDDAHQEKSFDYDLHIQQLMERARNDAGHPSGLPESHSTWAKEDAYFFQKANQIQHYKDGAFLEEEEDEESFSSNDEVEVDSWGEFDTPVHGVVPALSPDEERALRKKYEATLAEYDTSDSEDEYCNNEYGYNSTADALSVKIDSSAMMKHKATDEDQDDEIQTLRTNITTVAESQHALMDITDQQLESVLDSYLRDREDRKLAEGIIVSQRDKNKTGGSGYFALRQQPEEEKEDFSLDIIIEELAPAPEEVLIDGKSYFSEKKQNPWDCESILSTYSNLDNNPHVIQRIGGSSKKKKNKSNSDLIQLSNKTGLPLAADGNLSKIRKEEVSLRNKGEARKRGESAQEKAARKEAARKDKHAAKLQKKIMKQVFKEESRKLEVGLDGVGQSVFRY